MIPLQELSQVLQGQGLDSAVSRGHLLIGIPGKRKRIKWNGRSEHGYALILFLDLLEKAGFFYTFSFTNRPGKSRYHLEALPKDEDAAVINEWGATRTESVAHAVLSASRAGLLGGTR